MSDFAVDIDVELGFRWHIVVVMCHHFVIARCCLIGLYHSRSCRILVAAGVHVDLSGIFFVSGR